MSETTDSHADWIRRMLGMPIPLDGMGPLGSGPPQGNIDRPPSGNQKNQPPQRVRRKAIRGTDKVSIGDKGVSVQKVGDMTLYTAPPPPIREVNFAGGGGKGTALFGAVEALASGTMDEVKQVNGSSVGAITSALLAAGITVDELGPIVDSTGTKANTVSLITDGTMGKPKAMLLNALKNRGSPLTGDGVKEVIALNMDETLRARIKEYQDDYKLKNGENDKVVDTILDHMDPKDGPTFKQMRDLSAIIPKIKDITITATYTKELDLSDGGGNNKKKQAKGKNKESQLMVFSADTVPDMPVALGVQASAAFPIAFSPVDIDLSKYMRDIKDTQSGNDMKDRKSDAWKVRFIDGGVMNNTPTKSSIGDERPLDPIPQERSLNFVFQESNSDKMINGGLLPKSREIGDRVSDGITSSKNWAAEYALSIDAQEHAQDFVVVPLKFQWKKDNGETVDVDMSGMLNGTLNFDPDPQIVAEIRKRTKEVTENQLKETQKPITRQFASDIQMQMAISLAELDEMANAKPPYPQSVDSLDMRKKVSDAIDDAKKRKWSDPGKTLEKEVSDFLGDMDKLAGGDKDKMAYIAREIAKAKIARLTDNVGKKGVTPTGVGKAVGLVEESKKVFSISQRVLKSFIYPKMRDENPDGASIVLLTEVSQTLRQAVSFDELKRQFKRLIDHYRGKSDKKRFIPLPGLLVKSHDHKQFYKDMVNELKSVERVAKNA